MLGTTSKSGPDRRSASASTRSGTLGSSSPAAFSLRAWDEPNGASTAPVRRILQRLSARGSRGASSTVIRPTFYSRTGFGSRDTRIMQFGCRTPKLLSWASVKTIQIRNVPDAVHATLRTRATAAGVSLSDYALAELERIAERPAVSDVLRRAGSRAGGAATADIVAAVRAGRDRE